MSPPQALETPPDADALRLVRGGAAHEAAAVVPPDAGPTLEADTQTAVAPAGAPTPGASIPVQVRPTRSSAFAAEQAVRFGMDTKRGKGGGRGRGALRGGDDVHRRADPGSLVFPPAIYPPPDLLGPFDPSALGLRGLALVAPPAYPTGHPMAVVRGADGGGRFVNPDPTRRDTDCAPCCTCLPASPETVQPSAGPSTTPAAAMQRAAATGTGLGLMAFSAIGDEPSVAAGAVPSAGNVYIGPAASDPATPPPQPDPAQEAQGRADAAAFYAENAEAAAAGASQTTDAAEAKDAAAVAHASADEAARNARAAKAAAAKAPSDTQAQAQRAARAAADAARAAKASAGAADGSVRNLERASEASGGGGKGKAGAGGLGDAPIALPAMVAPGPTSPAPPPAPTRPPLHPQGGVGPIAVPEGSVAYARAFVQPTRAVAEGVASARRPTAAPLGPQGAPDPRSAPAALAWGGAALGPGGSRDRAWRAPPRVTSPGGAQATPLRRDWIAALGDLGAPVRGGNVGAEDPFGWGAASGRDVTKPELPARTPPAGPGATGAASPDGLPARPGSTAGDAEAARPRAAAGGQAADALYAASGVSTPLTSAPAGRADPHPPASAPRAPPSVAGAPHLQGFVPAVAARLAVAPAGATSGIAPAEAAAGPTRLAIGPPATGIVGAPAFRSPGGPGAFEATSPSRGGGGGGGGGGTALERAVDAGRDAQRLRDQLPEAARRVKPAESAAADLESDLSQARAALTQLTVRGASADEVRNARARVDELARQYAEAVPRAAQARADLAALTDALAATEAPIAGYLATHPRDGRRRLDQATAARAWRDGRDAVTSDAAAEQALHRLEARAERGVRDATGSLRATTGALAAQWRREGTAHAGRAAELDRLDAIQLELGDRIGSGRGSAKERSLWHGLRAGEGRRDAERMRMATRDLATSRRLAATLGPWIETLARNPHAARTKRSTLDVSLDAVKAATQAQAEEVAALQAAIARKRAAAREEKARKPSGKAPAPPPPADGGNVAAGDAAAGAAPQAARAAALDALVALCAVGTPSAAIVVAAAGGPLDVAYANRQAAADGDVWRTTVVASQGFDAAAATTPVEPPAVGAAIVARCQPACCTPACAAGAACGCPPPVPKTPPGTKHAPVGGEERAPDPDVPGGTKRPPGGEDPEKRPTTAGGIVAPEGTEATKAPPPPPRCPPGVVCDETPEQAPMPPGRTAAPGRSPKILDGAEVAPLRSFDRDGPEVEPCVRVANRQLDEALEALMHFEFRSWATVVATAATAASPARFAWCRWQILRHADPIGCAGMQYGTIGQAPHANGPTPFEAVRQAVEARIDPVVQAAVVRLRHALLRLQADAPPAGDAGAARRWCEHTQARLAGPLAEQATWLAGVLALVDLWLSLEQMAEAWACSAAVSAPLSGFYLPLHAAAKALAEFLCRAMLGELNPFDATGSAATMGEVEARPRLQVDRVTGMIVAGEKTLDEAKETWRRVSDRVAAETTAGMWQAILVGALAAAPRMLQAVQGIRQLQSGRGVDVRKRAAGDEVPGKRSGGETKSGGASDGGATPEGTAGSPSIGKPRPSTTKDIDRIKAAGSDQASRVQEYDSIIREHQADFDGWRADRVNGTSGEVVYVGDARPQNSVVIDAQGGIWRPRPSATNLFRTELVGRDVRVRINYEQFERK